MRKTLKSVLLLSPTPREREQVPAIAAEMGINVIFDEFDCDYFDSYLTETPNLSAPKLDLIGLIDRTVERYRDSNLSGVTSAVGYPGALAASIIAKELSLPGPSIDAITVCDHKYYSRLQQKKLVPEATPGFHLIDLACPNRLEIDEDFPIFLKPAKSCMSRNAYRINSRWELQQRIATALLPRQFVEPFDEVLRRYTGLTQSASCLLREDFLVGSQVSMEGYVSYGAVKVLGIIDAIMFPGTLSFARFQYPSTLPARILGRMEDIASRFFSGIGYDHAMFNMELIYDAEQDRIAIIEINPKISSQFPSLFLKVDGYSTYRTLLELAIGATPIIHERKGMYNVAASCVLRAFEDHFVLAVPTDEEQAKVLELFPDTRIQIYARKGKKLSDEVQDSLSFRYALIDLGAASASDLDWKFSMCKSMLPFTFEPCSRGDDLPPRNGLLGSEASRLNAGGSPL